eukprot:3205495-Rhodomonas_salina.2
MKVSCQFSLRFRDCASSTSSVLMMTQFLDLTLCVDYDVCRPQFGPARLPRPNPGATTAECLTHVSDDRKQVTKYDPVQEATGLVRPEEPIRVGDVLTTVDG